MVTRKQIVTEARKWINTPFRHQGRMPGIGVDCVGLVLCVIRDVGLGDWLGEFSVYPPQPVNGLVHQTCCARLRQKDISKVAPGDILTLRVPETPSHVAIVTDLGGKLGMIHAYAGGATRRRPARVVEHLLDQKWRKRIAGVFEFPGVGD